jgi:hypothetical protein
MSHSNFWTPEKVAELKKIAPKMTLLALEQHFNVSSQAVYGKCIRENIQFIRVKKRGGENNKLSIQQNIALIKSNPFKNFMTQPWKLI